MSAPDFAASVARLLDDDGTHPGPAPKPTPPSRPLFAPVPPAVTPPAAGTRRGPEVGGRPSDLRSMPRQKSTGRGGRSAPGSSFGQDGPTVQTATRAPRGSSALLSVVPRDLRRRARVLAALARITR